ncbi:MAG: helix-hairpin-helix domain-containing protein, partial [Gemmatimonadales bacterium]|nr:helix-hairpin-helix domain-containing protein [Gemmatimonadales bacterium]
IGPARAASIVQYRAQHGPFRSVEDLGRVPGLGPAALARVREHLALP